MYGIPYFKNSTPLWSCRGVLRDQVIPILKKQFGDFESNIIHFMTECWEMSLLNTKYVIQPYLDSIRFFKHGAKIRLNIDMMFNMTIWNQILIKIMHHYGSSMISLKSKNGFIGWLNKIISNNLLNQYELNKSFFAYINYSEMNLYIINFDSVKTISDFSLYTDLDDLLNENIEIKPLLHKSVKFPNKINKLF
jgi:hypothetical protein